MMKKLKRSHFKLVEEKRIRFRRSNLLKYIPNQPKLIEFLIENKADKGFIKALKKSGKGDRGTLYRLEDTYDSICGSFTWRHTIEGYSYWDNLNNEFNKIMRGDNE